MNSSHDAPEIIVSLGTDHHHFDRLVSWMDEWLQQQDPVPTCLVQHGSTAAPRVADGVELLSRERMLELYGSARVAVVQGGPGSIFDVRLTGLVPIAVPRVARLDEVVDDHQVAFCRQLEREGELILAESREALFAALDSALLTAATTIRTPRESPAPRAARALGEVLAAVQSDRVGLVSIRRARQSFARPGSTPQEAGHNMSTSVAGKTVVLCVQGGLGNQLFQYALARSLEQSGARVFLDVVRCRGDRPLMLGGLTDRFPRLPRTAGLAIAAADRTGWAWKTADAAGVTRVKETGFAVVTGLRERMGRRTVLTGYFQSPAYFEDVEEAVRHEIATHLRGMLTPAGIRFADSLTASGTSVAVHVRRGDYVANTTAANHHGALGKGYYEKALAQLDAGGPRQRIWFSDDLDWVARELAEPGDTLCPEGLTTAAGGEIALMAACNARVIANSSFSWWAGFLGAPPTDANPVIAPLAWFADGHDDAGHLVPSTWLRI